MSDTTITIPEIEIDFDCTLCPGFNRFPAHWHLMGKKKEETSVIWKEWYLCRGCHDHFTTTDEHKDYNYVSERLRAPVSKNITERGRNWLKIDQLDLNHSYGNRCDCPKQLAQCTGCGLPHFASPSTGLSSCLQLLKCCEETQHAYGFLCVKCVKGHKKDCYREKRKLPDAVDCTSCGKNVKTSDWASRCINKEKDSWLCLDCIGEVKKIRLTPESDMCY